MPNESYYSTISSGKFNDLKRIQADLNVAAQERNTLINKIKNLKEEPSYTQALEVKNSLQKRIDEINYAKDFIRATNNPIEELNHKIRKNKGQIEYIKSQTIEMLIPFTGQNNQSANKTGQEYINYIKELCEKAELKRYDVKIISKVLDLINRNLEQFKALEEENKNLNSKIELIKDLHKGEQSENLAIVKEYNKAIDEINTKQKKIGKVEESLKKFTDRIKRYSDEYNKLNAELNSIPEKHEINVAKQEANERNARKHANQKLNEPWNSNLPFNQTLLTSRRDGNNLVLNTSSLEDNPSSTRLGKTYTERQKNPSSSLPPVKNDVGPFNR